jgi:alpha-amylase
MYMRESSPDGKHFSMPVKQDCMLPFSRILYDEEILVVYNSSLTNDDEEYIGVDAHLNPEGSTFRYCYGAHGKVHVLKNEEDTRHFVKIKLKPSQFVILTNRNIT